MKHKVIIDKIIKYINKIIDYTETCTYESFSENNILVEACVFNLGQIGELSNKIDKEFQNIHDDIPWKVLYGLRNRIVHDYEGVNLVLIWEIIKNDLPELRLQLQNLQGINNSDYNSAHQFSSNHKKQLLLDKKCGCFYCLNIFDPKEITEWVEDMSGTAICPYCGVDAVIGESSGYPITKDFLAAMKKHWF